jgi:3-hydroxypropionyl-CoA synthetase (ADP-forming)
MVGEGVEIIIGFNNDPVFGPVLMLGIGGIFTEIIRDVVFRVLPIDRHEALEMIKELKYSDLLLEGYRGMEGVSPDTLADVIFKISEFALELSPYIDSFDMNPLIMRGDEYRIVDFKYTPSPGISKAPFPEPDVKHIDGFFNAESVAVIGASGSSEKLGNYILRSLERQDHNGRIYPIHPKFSKIMGMKSYPAVVDVPQDLDFVVVTIPLNGVLDVLEDCNKKNIHNMVIVSAGGKETGNIKLEEDIKEKAKEYGVRIIGCNCIGVMDGYNRLDTFFYPEHKVIKPGSGNIAMLAQSGTVGVSFLEKITDYGISKFISYGNRMDVDEGDLLEFLAGDDKTEVIAIYIEGLENGSKFFRAAKKVAEEKPIVIFKAGRSRQSSNLSKSHTGFLSESYDLSLSVFHQAKIIPVDSLEALVASVKILSRFKRTNGNRIGVITNGAGAVIQAMDLMEQEKKLELAEITDHFRRDLLSRLPNYALVENIIDLTGVSSDSDYKTAVSQCYENEEMDIVMIWVMLQNPFISEDFYLIFKDYVKNSKKPLIIGAAGEEYTREVGKRIEGLGIPVFYTVDDWVAAATAISNKKGLN